MTVKLRRELVYSVGLSGFYTFLVVFCLRLEFGVIILTSVIITLISYVWVIIAASKHGPAVVDYKDIFVNVFVFSFISFYIVFVAFIFSGTPFTPIRLIVASSPIFVWTVVWADVYFQRVKAKV
jgi:hypothetical protein